MPPDVQLAEMVPPDEIENHADRLAERKLDGVRCVTENGRLFTRSGNDVTERFPEIVPPEAHVLDGEIVTRDFEFESALRRVQTQDQFKISLYVGTLPARLVVFDVLEVNGGDVTDKPYTERRELLEPSIPSDAGIIVNTTHDDPAALWEKAEAHEWEGIMLKDPDARYSAGRGRDWLKVKRWTEQTFPIISHEHTENDGFVVYVEIGADEPQKVAVNGRDDQAVVQQGADAAEIQFLERSPDGRLRMPSFRGVA